MSDHNLRFYFQPDRLKDDSVISQVRAWPSVEMGREGDESFLQISHDHLVDLPHELIPPGLPALFRRIGTGKVSLKSIYRDPHPRLKDGLYIVGRVKVSRLGFGYLAFGENHLAVIRAYKTVIAGGTIDLAIYQSDTVLRKQLGRLGAANDQLRHEAKERGAKFAEVVNNGIKGMVQVGEKLNALYDEVEWYRLPFWERWFTPRPTKNVRESRT